MMEEIPIDWLRFAEKEEALNDSTPFLFF